jgi:hypothetical protein
VYVHAIVIEDHLIFMKVPYNPQVAKEMAPDPYTAARIEKLEEVLTVVVRHQGGLWGFKQVKEWMAGETPSDS